jgi:hypothetical protein
MSGGEMADSASVVADNGTPDSEDEAEAAYALLLVQDAAETDIVNALLWMGKQMERTPVDSAATTITFTATS